MGLTWRLGALLAIFILPPNSYSQTNTAIKEESVRKKAETLPIVGTRVKGQSASDATSPVEIFQDEAISQTGEQELGRVLQKLVPSFNFSSTTVSDGTDIIRPATMRGLGPDQLLVLINGKRRHSQALVNVQQTVGRGSSGIDINAIPPAAIQRIEVLRDGAAAQYGSDAIAGVINIVLKDRAYGSEIQQSGGRTYSGDGDTIAGSINQGFGLLDGGVNLTLAYRNRDATNRAGTDERFNRQTMQIGDAESKNLYFFANGYTPITSRSELYFNGGISERRGESAGVFRAPGDEQGRVLPEFYPDGLLPILGTTVRDRSVTLGYRLELGNRFDVDLSSVYGESEFEYASLRSHNVSLGLNSPTSSTNGTLSSSEWTSNLGVKGELDFGFENPVHLAFGFENRETGYQIKEGEFASYAYGVANDPSIFIAAPSGGRAPAGMQGFPGFQPTNAVDATSQSTAAYVDLESRVIDEVNLGLAGRVESHEQAGDSTTGKISARYDITPHWALRSTASTGFRAPSLAQRKFNNTSTTFAGNELTETLVANEDHPLMEAFGIRDLKHETSQSVSVGVLTRFKSVHVALDAYQIDIKDRIVLTGMIEPEDASNPDACLDLSACPIKSNLSALNVGAMQFFTNAIDTRTRGLDLTSNYDFRNGPHRYDLGLSATWQETKVTAIHEVAQDLDKDVIFDEGQRVLTEKAQPRQRTTVSFGYGLEDFHSKLSVHRYGPVSAAGFGYNQEFDARIITDIIFGYTFSKTYTLELGANNLFNVFPEKLKDDHPNRQIAGGSFQYPWETAPFGTNGGYYFTRLTARL